VTDRTVVLAVDDATPTLTADDRALANALVQRGVGVEPVVWGSRRPHHETVVIRSTWDYVSRPARFREWLDELDDDGVVVHNSTDLIRWNMHKGYLGELADRSVPVVSTALVERGSSVGLDEVMTAHGWESAVVKPAIGATARHTIRVDGSHRTEAVEHFRRLVAAEDVLVQPFVQSITTEGEVSIVAIGGTPSHVVHKRPQVGEWRVQSDFGGTIDRLAMTDEYAAAALTALAAVDGNPACGRVDVVRFDGQLHLMELELIEPDLFFRLAPEAADALADLITGV